MKTLLKKGFVFLTEEEAFFDNMMNKGGRVRRVPVRLQERNRLRVLMQFFDFLYELYVLCQEHFNWKKIDLIQIVRQLLKKATQGNFPRLRLDMRKVKLIYGPLAAPGGAMNLDTGLNTLNFAWAPCTQADSDPNDELMLLLYCPSLRKLHSEGTLGIRRKDEFCSFQVPQVFHGHSLHVWAAYRSADGKNSSDSTYYGEVLINHASHEAA